MKLLVLKTKFPKSLDLSNYPRTNFHLTFTAAWKNKHTSKCVLFFPRLFILTLTRLCMWKRIACICVCMYGCVSHGCFRVYYFLIMLCLRMCRKHQMLLYLKVTHTLTHKNVQSSWQLFKTHTHTHTYSSKILAAHCADIGKLRKNKRTRTY